MNKFLNNASGEWLVYLAYAYADRNSNAKKKTKNS